MAFMAGLKVVEISEATASISVKYKWLNKNPFASLYFAVLSMAGEMSTGLLAFGQIYKRKPTVSMLVVKLEAEFYKKAIGKIVFTCADGIKIKNAVDLAIETGNGQTIECIAIGKNEMNENVAMFKITWSFKMKK
ncbi:MAG: thioesterase [Bacteroidetes bacterium]|nr:thioesterase [Bacteroidota bacterium]MBS1648619.1 thioesterase [Bacteroidota bacterium]